MSVLNKEVSIRKWLTTSTSSKAQKFMECKTEKGNPKKNVVHDLRTDGPIQLYTGRSLFSAVHL